MPPVGIGVLISGGGTNLQAIIDSIENGKINGKIELIISNRKDAYGLTRGELAGIESLYIDRKTFEKEEDYNQEILKQFKARNIELIVLAGYLRVLSKNIIEEFENRIINIHPSLIPSFSGKGYYGDKVHQAVLDAGVKITGASVHFVDEGTDTGPIILQDIVKLSDDESLDSLKDKVLKLEHKLLVRAVKLYCENRIRVDGRRVTIN